MGPYASDNNVLAGLLRALERAGKVRLRGSQTSSWSGVRLTPSVDAEVIEEPDYQGAVMTDQLRPYRPVA